jgi:hypothetical protein
MPIALKEVGKSGRWVIRDIAGNAPDVAPVMAKINAMIAAIEAREAKEDQPKPPTPPSGGASAVCVDTLAKMDVDTLVQLVLMLSAKFDKLAEEVKALSESK